MPFINPHALERKTQQMNNLGLSPKNQISIIQPDPNINQKQLLIFKTLILHILRVQILYILCLQM